MSKNDILSEYYTSGDLTYKLEWYTKDPHELEDLVAATFTALCEKSDDVIIEAYENGKLQSFAVNIGKRIFLNERRRKKAEELPTGFDLPNADSDDIEDRIEIVNDVVNTLSFYEKTFFNTWVENDFNTKRATDAQVTTLKGVNKQSLYGYNKAVVKSIKEKCKLKP